MKKLTSHVHTLVIAFILIAGCHKKDDSVNPSKPKNELNWIAMETFPGVARSSASGFWIEDKFYVGFGSGLVNNHEQDLNDFYEYNSVTNTWTRLADFPGIGREGVTAFGLGSKGYIGFGQSIVNCNPLCSFVYPEDLWEYNPVLNSWDTLGTYSQIGNGQGVYSRSYVVNGKVYLIIDINIWVFDPSDSSLVKINQVPEGLSFSTGFKIKDRIYIGTGTTSTLETTFYEFDPGANTLTKKADFAGQARYLASGFALNNKGYILCGQGSKQVSPGVTGFYSLKDTWQYDPVTDKWTEFNNYPGLGRIFQVSSNSEGMACVGSGEIDVVSSGKDFWLIK